MLMRIPSRAAAAQPNRVGARSSLASLMDLVGSGGLSAAAANPGLLALVDQHAAAVRDSLYGDLRELSTVTLAGYAEGVRAAATEHGWCPPLETVNWSTDDWVSLRLLAVCALAKSLPHHR